MTPIEDIHVIFAPDENYLVHTGVAMASMLRHAKHPQRLHFYFLEGEEQLPADGRGKLRKIAERYNCKLEFIVLKTKVSPSR